MTHHSDSIACTDGSASDRLDGRNNHVWRQHGPWLLQQGVERCTRSGRDQCQSGNKAKVSVKPLRRLLSLLTSSSSSSSSSYVVFFFYVFFFTSFLFAFIRFLLYLSLFQFQFLFLLYLSLLFFLLVVLLLDSLISLFFFLPFLLPPIS